MKVKIKKGSIVRLKKGNPSFLGLVKDLKVFGDELVTGDNTVILNVYWFMDPDCKVRPTVNEVELIS
jgi:hypothetical protein